MIKEDNIGELGDYPNEKYRQFFSKFPEINTLKTEEWKPVHLLAYFSRKYKETYQIDYQFKFNAPLPSKCFEVFQIKRLGVILTSNPVLLREYIDWVYLTKVPEAKRRLTSISFLTKEETVSEYKLKVLFADKSAGKIDRTSPLPTNYQEIFEQANMSVRTYGDLSFLLQVPNKSDDVLSSLAKLKQLGFDEETIKRVS